MPLLFIAGHILNRAYQEAKLVAEDIVHVDDTNLQLESKGMLEYQWFDYLSQQKRALGGKALEHDASQPLVVHSALGYLGGLDELLAWATASYADYADPRDEPEYAEVEDELQTLADREFAAYIQTQSGGSVGDEGEGAASNNGTSNNFVYLDFSSPALEKLVAEKEGLAALSRPGTAVSRPGTQAGVARRRSLDGAERAAGEFGPHRVIIELFADKCPRAAENFRKLCTGEAGEAQTEDGRAFQLHYLHSAVHRVQRDGWIQGGDIVSGRGCDSHSALGSATFPDENLSIPLDGPGLLCMANSGPHSNGSQWLLTLRELPALQGKYVVLGRVVHGLHTLHLINQLPLRSNQRPVDPLRIVACDLFGAAMLDANVHRWTRRRAPPRRKKTAASRSGTVAPESLSPRLQPKKATILVVGLEGAGKSTIVHNLQQRPWEPTNPTVGFERAAVFVRSESHGPFDVALWGLGGAKNIRGYWPNYLDAVHGLVFVVDAARADEQSWQDAAAEFQSLLSHPLVRGKPVLVYANKQDQPGARSMTEVSMRLGADALVARLAQGGAAVGGDKEGGEEKENDKDSDKLGVSPTHFVKCVARTDLAAGQRPPPKDSPLSPASAALHPSPSPDPEHPAPAPASSGSAADVDPDIPRGFQWLLARVGEQYASLCERVARDVAEQKRRAREEMEASRAKIARQKEEREAAEAAAAEAEAQAAAQAEAEAVATVRAA